MRGGGKQGNRSKRTERREQTAEVTTKKWKKTYKI
jgi:hypothetical protein